MLSLRAAWRSFKTVINDLGVGSSSGPLHDISGYVDTFSSAFSAISDYLDIATGMMTVVNSILDEHIPTLLSAITV